MNANRRVSLGVRVTIMEMDWIAHAAKLRHMSFDEYVKQAINESLRREGVDAVLLKVKGDR